MTMLNINQGISKKLIKLLGNRGLCLFSLTSTSKSQDVPVDSDPPPSFMASGWEAQECLVPTYWRVLGSVAKRRTWPVRYLQEWWHCQKSTYVSVCLSVTPGRPPLKVYRWGKSISLGPLQWHFLSNRSVSGCWGPSPRMSAETRHKLTIKYTYRFVSQADTDLLTLS